MHGTPPRLIRTDTVGDFSGPLMTIEPPPALRANCGSPEPAQPLVEIGEVTVDADVEPTP